MTTLTTPLSLGNAGTLPPVIEPAGKSTARRIGKWLLSLSIGVSCLLAVLFLVFHAYVAWAFSHPNIVRLGSNPTLAKNLAYSDVSFPSADNASLVDGWWIPSAAASARTVILSHGFGANREELWVPMYDLADLLHGSGYNVLMFDYGFANEKHRQAATGGREESQQLLGAIQYARGQGSDEIVVWGFSMGAGTALQAALHSDPVDAMILDSTFIPDDDTLYYNIRQQVDIPKYPTVSLIRWFFPFVSGGSRLERIPSAEVQNTAYDFPILLIHGTDDDKAPAYLSENVARAQKNALSQLWVVPGAIHEMIYRTHPQEYVSRTTGFLAQVHAGVVAKRASAEVARL